MSTAEMVQSEDHQNRISPVRAAQMLWPYLKAYQGKFLLSGLLILLSTGVEVVNPIIVGLCVDAAISPGKGMGLKILCLIFFTLILTKFFLDFVQAYVIQSTGQSITHELRSLMFSRIERLPVGYFDRNPTGRLLTRVINDIKSLSELFTASISVLALDAMIIVGTVGAMFYMHWKLAGLVLLAFPFVLFIIEFFGRRLAGAYRSVRRALSEINAFLGENIGAISTIQRLAAEEERMKKFTRIVDTHNVAQMHTLRVFSLVQPLTNLFNGICTGTLLLVGGYWAIQGKITVGLVVAFLGYLRNLFQPIRDLVEKYNTFLSAMVSVERVVGILDEPTEEMTGNWFQPQKTAFSVSFENVSFRYPTRSLNALNEVSFEVKPRESLAIVGATGSGKSTIIRLLLRFYEPNSGKILVGDSPLLEWDKGSLRQQIGVVHQEIYLFQGTIRENLTLGREGYSDSYLREQCERAQLWSFIEPRGGLDMHVFEGGSNFSLGERQLLSFARVLVFDAPLLVLDEATSSVDRRLERKLLAAIAESLAGRTSIVIAHRLTTIEECDRVLVLDKGKIAEEGSYDELLRSNGLFSKYHEIHTRA
jgi:ATP-binding cassette, subfamily B, multidrug efflux pump